MYSSFDNNALQYYYEKGGGYKKESSGLYVPRPFCAECAIGNVSFALQRLSYYVYRITLYFVKRHCLSKRRKQRKTRNSISSSLSTCLTTRNIEANQITTVTVYNA